MPSKDRVRSPKGRAIPGGVGSFGLRTWGPDGLYRVTEWIKRLKVVHGPGTVAEKAGVSRNALMKICYDAQDPSPEFAEKIAAAFGVDLSVVVRGSAAGDLGYMQGRGAS